MAKSVIGLDVGGSSVRVVEMTAGPRPQQIAAAAVPLPPGAIVGGQLKEPEIVTEAIKQAWAQGKISHDEAAMTIANSSVVIRIADLGWLPASGFRKTLPYQVKDQLPVPVEETYLDYYPISEDIVTEGGQERRVVKVLLVAAKREMVDAFTSVARDAGVKPTSVDITSLSLIRATTPAFVADAPTVALVHIGADVVNLVVHRGGVPQFVRLLPSSGSRQVTNAVKDALNVPFSEAEELKVRIGLGDLRRLPQPPQADVFGGNGDAAAPAAAAGDHPAAPVIREQATSLINEVRTSLEFIAGQPNLSDTPITEVVLSGGGARLQGLGQRMASELRLPVRLFDPHTRVDNLVQAQSPVDPDLTAAIGAALGV